MIIYECDEMQQTTVSPGGRVWVNPLRQRGEVDRFGIAPSENLLRNTSETLLGNTGLKRHYSETTIDGKPLRTAAYHCADCDTKLSEVKKIISEVSSATNLSSNGRECDHFEVKTFRSFDIDTETKRWEKEVGAKVVAHNAVKLEWEKLGVTKEGNSFMVLLAPSFLGGWNSMEKAVAIIRRT